MNTAKYCTVFRITFFNSHSLSGLNIYKFTNADARVTIKNIKQIFFKKSLS